MLGTQKNFDLDRALNKFVDENGRVNYLGLRNSPDLLWNYLDFIKSASPRSNPELFNTKDSKIAYWINTYNALIIKIIIENPNLSSIKSVSWGYGAFWRLKHEVGGEQLSLNYIEHKILREKYKDPRIHFAINCASNSCPPLGKKIITGEKLNDQLEKKTSDFINNKNNVSFNHKNKTLKLNRIFKWYKKDFEGGHQSLTEFILSYINDFSIKENQKIILNYKLKYMEYDWGLNQSKN